MMPLPQHSGRQVLTFGLPENELLCKQNSYRNHRNHRLCYAAWFVWPPSTVICKVFPRNSSAEASLKCATPGRPDMQMPYVDFGPGSCRLQGATGHFGWDMVELLGHCQS